MLAGKVLDVQLSFFALLASFFVFTAYKVSGERGRAEALTERYGPLTAVPELALDAVQGEALALL